MLELSLKRSAYIAVTTASIAPRSTKRYNTVELRISDYLQTMAHFRTAAQWWNGQLYIIGMSEGGLTTGMVAAFAPETKRVAILSYGGGLTMAEARPDAIAAETLKDKKTPAQADAESANAVRTYDEIRKDPQLVSTELFHIPQLGEFARSESAWLLVHTGAMFSASSSVRASRWPESGSS
jgi:dienelactone hydrolase